MSGPAFLSAEWRHLAMLSYEADPKALQPYVPAGTELDDWQGKTFLSLIGFLFLRTRLLGVPVPFHGRFEEVNLRFYVRRRAEDGWRRGVVFIRELVPLRTVAFLARSLYQENYTALPMSHGLGTDAQGRVRSVSYRWESPGMENRIDLSVEKELSPLQDGTLSAFIAEHYWGYGRQRDGGTLEYRVEHPRWNHAEASSAALTCDAAGLYEPPLAGFLSGPPASAFFADGSRVVLHRGRRLP